MMRGRIRNQSAVSRARARSGARRPPAARLILVALVLVLAAGLRFARIDHQSLWYDEGNSARAAERPIAQIVRDSAHDIHPPGYYILLAGWQDLTGSSELALRMFSALLGVLSVALVYAIGARLFSRSTGVLAALFAAVNPFQVWYAQEARMYALLGALSAASVLLTASILTIPRDMAAGRSSLRRAGPAIGAYALVNAAGLYTHYTFPFILLAESLAFLIWLAGRPRRLHALATWALIHLAALALYAPWLPTAYRQLTTWPRVPGESVTLLKLGGAVAYGLTTPPEAVKSGLIPLLILVAVGLFPPLEIGRGYLSFAERLGLVAAWLLVPVAIPVAMDVVREPYLKFFVPSGLALQVLAARGVVMGVRLSEPVTGAGALSPRLMRVIIAILVLVGLLPIYTGLQNLYTNPDYARDDYRAIAARVMAEAGPSAAVVLDAPNQVEVFTYYYPDGPGVTPLPNDRTEETLNGLLGSYDRIYAVYWGEGEQDPTRQVERVLNARAYIADSDWYGRVRLVTYVVPVGAASGLETPANARFGDTIRLRGYTLSAEALAPGEALAVTLFWQADAPLDRRYKVFVHLYTPGGTIAAQHDGEPDGGLQPTDGWQPGETVADNHGLLIPADAAPGTYPLMVGLYGPDGVRLPVESAQAQPDSRLLLAEIRVMSSP